MNITEDLIKKLPKAELHCHLDGSLRVDTIIDLANKQNIDLPTFDKTKLKDILEIRDNTGSLEEYLERFAITLSVLQTPDSLTRTAYELAEDCHKENIRYLEVRYSPVLHTDSGMTVEEAVDSVKIGLDKAEQDFGIKTGIIICGIRNISPEVSLTLANLTVKYKNKGVVGFDLAGAEENFPAKDHREAFYTILNNNINATIHAGEAFGPESIHQAVHYCGAHRIGHGTRLQEDIDLMNYINDHRIALEISLTSNFHTNVVRNLQEHPFKYYLDENLRVTLCTDNRLISSTTLSNEYWLATKLFNLTYDDICTIIINGFKSSFLPHKDRTALVKNVVNELQSEFGFNEKVIV
ncbi:MAG: adenosine deaminase [Candidatus Marinimicrobia bacterium]|nr:adenosine deaminase [Candidatus Neomarinimicrobiota bacterium]MBL7023648.1 adenosine deaminase [Candidatus Neomarinimicrobiota bacterium]MBL7109800.1 adenosine deaminase [Candidatus Neomarinimicrobiota bacterium]